MVLNIAIAIAVAAAMYGIRLVVERQIIQTLINQIALDYRFINKTEEDLSGLAVRLERINDKWCSAPQRAAIIELLGLITTERRKLWGLEIEMRR